MTSSKPRFKFRRPRRLKTKQGAAVRLLVDSDEYLPVILSAIESAQKQIVVENYMIASDASGRGVIDLLCEKARQGVSVWLVFDAVGSRHLTSTDQEKLRAAGARLYLYHPFRLFRLAKTLGRTHRRILVVDDRVAFVGGYGFTIHWSDLSPFGKYHERVWELRGSVLTDLLRSFRWGCRRYFDGSPEIYRVSAARENLPYQVLNLSEHGRQSALRRAARRLAHSSRRRVWIATGYFVPTLLFRRALARAARRGVDVRLYLTGAKTDHPVARYAARRRYRALLEAGVRIFESVERPMHAKCLVVDETLSNLGSANLDRWSIHFNRELNVSIVDQATNDQLAKSIEALGVDSVEIQLDSWKNRDFGNKLREWFAGLFEIVL